MIVMNFHSLGFYIGVFFSKKKSPYRLQNNLLWCDQNTHVYISTYIPFCRRKQCFAKDIEVNAFLLADSISILSILNQGRRKMNKKKIMNKKKKENNFFFGVQNPGFPTAEYITLEEFGYIFTNV